MKRVALTMFAAGLTASAALGATIKIDVQGPNGESKVTVAPGETVNYRVLGELSNDPNLGLALIGLSLDFTGGDIGQPADEPTTDPMYNFDYDEIDAGHKEGLTNPIGFGGTLMADANHGGRIVIAQAGGCQNTIKNTADYAEFPTGSPITNVAVFGSPVVLATGSFTLPGTALAGSSYQLVAFDVFANVIKAGETGDVFYATQIVDEGGANTSLTVSVGGDVPVNFASSIPPFTGVGVNSAPLNGTLWRSARNTMRLTFDAALPGAPTAGQITIQELLDGGAFGDDVSANGFTFTLESGDTVLKIRDNDTTSDLLHRKWYAIRNTGGWAGVANFEAQFPVQVGDANGDKFVTPTDVGVVNAAPAGVQADQSRVDINGDGFKTPTDVGLANANQSGFLAKPTGH